MGVYQRKSRGLPIPTLQNSVLLAVDDGSGGLKYEETLVEPNTTKTNGDAGFSIANIGGDDVITHDLAFLIEWEILDSVTNHRNTGNYSTFRDDDSNTITIEGGLQGNDQLYIKGSTTNGLSIIQATMDASQLDWSNVIVEPSMASGDANPNPIYAVGAPNPDGHQERTLVIK